MKTIVFVLSLLVAVHNQSMAQALWNEPETEPEEPILLGVVCAGLVAGAIAGVVYIYSNCSEPPWWCVRHADNGTPEGGTYCKQLWRKDAEANDVAIVGQRCFKKQEVCATICATNTASEFFPTAGLITIYRGAKPSGLFYKVDESEGEIDCYDRKLVDQPLEMAFYQVMFTPYRKEP